VGANRLEPSRGSVAISSLPQEVVDEAGHRCGEEKRFQVPGGREDVPNAAIRNSGASPGQGCFKRAASSGLLIPTSLPEPLLAPVDPPLIGHPGQTAAAHPAPLQVVRCAIQLGLGGNGLKGRPRILRMSIGEQDRQHHCTHHAERRPARNSWFTNSLIAQATEQTSKGSARV
jgi:hypothetical protein